jgi:trk system potassium uptake protein TrkA
LTPPATFVGKNLIELDLINRLGIQVIAVTETVTENVVMIPTGRFVVKDSDLLVLLGPDKALAEVKEEFN